MSDVGRRLQYTLQTTPNRLAKLRRVISDPTGEEAIRLDIVPCDEPGPPPLAQTRTYAIVHNILSLFLEEVADFPQLNAWWRIADKAQVRFHLGGPEVLQLCPVTNAYFSQWITLDLRIGRTQETICSCMLDAADLLRLSDDQQMLLSVWRDSYVGIYECVDVQQQKVMLVELISGVEHVAYNSTQCQASIGELWYARLLPPISSDFDDSTIMTTPALFPPDSKPGWEEFLRSQASKRRGGTEWEAITQTLKHGPTPTFWMEHLRRTFVSTDLKGALHNAAPAI